MQREPFCKKSNVWQTSYPVWSSGRLCWVLAIWYTWLEDLRWCQKAKDPLQHLSYPLYRIKSQLSMFSMVLLQTLTALYFCYCVRPLYSKPLHALHCLVLLRLRAFAAENCCFSSERKRFFGANDSSGKSKIHFPSTEKHTCSFKFQVSAISSSDLSLDLNFWAFE